MEVSPIACLGWACRAKAIATRSSGPEAERWMVANGVPPQAIRLAKSAVGAGTSGQLGDYGGFSIAQWAQAMSTKSALFRILGDSACLHAPLNRRVAVVVTPSVGSVVEEGEAIPMSPVVLTYVTLKAQKAAALTVCTVEQLFDVSSGGQRQLNADLARAVAKAVDGAFFASLTDTGSTSSISASGTAATNAWRDLRAAALAISTPDGVGRPYMIAAPDVAIKLATLATADGAQAFAAVGAAGGELLNAPLLVSAGVPAGTLFMLDASGIVADGGVIVPDESTQGDVLLDTVPNMDSTTPTAAQLVNLWQTNSVGLKAQATFGVEKLREGCLAVVEGIDYGAAP